MSKEDRCHHLISSNSKCLKFELKISSLKFSFDWTANDFVRDFESLMKSVEKEWIYIIERQQRMTQKNGILPKSGIE